MIDPKLYYITLQGVILSTLTQLKRQNPKNIKNQVYYENTKVS